MKMFSIGGLLLISSMLCCSNPYVSGESYYMKLLSKARDNIEDSLKDTTFGNMDTSLKLQLNSQDLEFVQRNILLESVQASSENYTVSETCLNHTQMILPAAMSGQLWAVKMLDASGKLPSGVFSGNAKWYGSFDECNEVLAETQQIGSNDTYSLFGGKYCYAVIPVNKLTNNALLSMAIPEITVGLCVPDTCTALDTRQLIYDVLQPNDSTVDFDVVCHEGNLDLDTKAIIAIVIISILGCLILIGTLYDVFSGILSKEKIVTKATLRIDSKTSLISRSDKTTEPQTEIGGSILLAFSAYTNGKKIVSTTQGTGTLTAVNGIRFLSMTWVILGHSYSIIQASSSNFNDAYLRLRERWTFHAILNAFLAVDTFFTLSGLLLAYLVLKEMESKNGKVNWFIFYFHRFWRLTPPYMLVLMVDVALVRYMGNGPFWPSEGFEKNSCEDTWWKNLLYINNFWSMEDMCMNWSWYLANDMQFFIISPLMFLPLFISGVIGVVTCFIFLTGTIVASALISNAYDLPPSTAGGGPTAPGREYVDLYYIRPYTRIAPYIVGILTGYILYKIKCRAQIKWYLNIFGWIVATVLACLVLYGLYEPLKGGDPLSQEMSSFYNATHRTVWGACVCWVIFACATGNGGYINTLLSWSPFVPLGRLTYCAYLVHPLVIMLYVGSLRSPIYISDYTMIYQYLGHLLASYMVAFVTSLIFEAPMMGLEKVIFKRNKS